MALTTWTDRQETPGAFAKVNVWGNGTSPIHGRQGSGNRNQVPDVPPGDGYVPENVIGEVPGDTSYSAEDHSATYGYGFETGLADRPKLGQRSGRGVMPVDYPEPGPHSSGLPAGTKLRSQRHGSLRMLMQQALYSRPVVQELVNKDHSMIPNDSVTANVSQLYVQTGEVQGIRTRSGSQRTGTQSDFNAPVSSRVRGMKIQEYAGGERHDDMRPRQQSPGRHRGFFSRQAGTGNPNEMTVNAAYQSVPRTRQPPAAPDQGLSTPALSVGYGGFTDEDPTWT